MSDSIEHILLGLLPWAFGFVALVTLGVALWSRRWPKVVGTIEVSFTDVEASLGTRGRTLQTTYEEKHHLMYTYEVDGVLYGRTSVAPLFSIRVRTTSNSASFPRWSTDRALANELREGATVDVYFCPLYHGWSCLRPGGYGAAVLFGVIAAVLLVVL